MNKKIFYWGIFIIAIIGAFFLFGSGEKTNAVANVGETNHSWGEIPIQGGNVSHEFEIKNEGTDPLVINSIETSCVCTTAQLIVDEDVSPLFSMKHAGGGGSSWRGEIAPGQVGIIRAVFDPMFHGPTALGPITRTVKVRTNDGIHEFKLDGDVVAGNITDEQ